MADAGSRWLTLADALLLPHIPEVTTNGASVRADRAREFTGGKRAVGDRLVRGVPACRAEGARVATVPSAA